jgi:chitinase
MIPEPHPISRNATVISSAKADGQLFRAHDFSRGEQTLIEAAYLNGIAPRSSANAPKSLWVTGYYPAWQDKLKPADIDYGSLTHVIYFTLFPTADGGLDMSNGVNDATANALASAAHSAGKKVLICVGGDGAVKPYRHAIKSSVRETFVRNIVDWVNVHHYDGVDVDFEPMKASDVSDFQAFIRSLRAHLNQLEGAGRPPKLITAAVECQGPTEAFAPVQGDFDQLNLMTYDMAGSWSDEIWYNSPLMNGAGVRGIDGELLPSTDQFVTRWLKQIPASKLGIGICCEGRVWHGADAVGRVRNDAKVETRSYADIIDNYANRGRYWWDTKAKASFIVVPGDANSKAVVVYDDIPDCIAKVRYARAKGLGGLILWELSEEYRPNEAPYLRHPLSTAVHNEVTWPSTVRGVHNATRRAKSR